MKNDSNWAWRLYEEGKRWNHSLSPDPYTVAAENAEFVAGNQWRGLPDTPAMRSLPHPVFNILKRAEQLFVASLTSTNTAVHLRPLAYYDGKGTEDPYLNVTNLAEAEVRNLLAKFNIDRLSREAMEDAATTGDFCAHLFWDADAIPYGGGLNRYGPYRGEIQIELVDGINVLFGNPNDRRVEKQPWIIIAGRDTVENLAEEQKRFRKNRDFYQSGKAAPKESEVKPDADNQDFVTVGGKTEMTGEGSEKALYIYLYTKIERDEPVTDENGLSVMDDVLDGDGNPVYLKDNGQYVLGPDEMPIQKRKERTQRVTSVFCTKATKDAIIYENVDTGLSRYPVAWGNWMKQKGQYHGRALVTELIPNQIAINRFFAVSIDHLLKLAFPVTMYNANLLSRWPMPGEAVALHNIQPTQTAASAAHILQPAEISGQIFTMVDRIFEMTKECIGLTDVIMGTANAENTSALMLQQANAETPLGNQKDELQGWVESICYIVLDMMGTYYGTRPVVVNREVEVPVICSDGMPQYQMDSQGYPISVATQRQTKASLEEYDFSLFKNLFFNVSAVVGNAGKFSEMAFFQFMKELRQDGTVTAEELVKSAPLDILPNKEELLEELKSRIARGEQPNAAAGAAIQQPGSPVSMQLAPIQSGGGMTAANYNNLPTRAQNVARKVAEMRG